ncbi:MAG: Mini-ribonuclease 3 [Clostridioides sp.]|nr:Mini-ribonuclease 3 [Clostridioides sp.]
MTISPLVLAYIGDTVYETYVRGHLIRNFPHKRVNELHKLAITYVKAKAQADIIHVIESDLSEEELRIFKRGRNQKPHTFPKNGSIIDYKHATGFEALVGYLYLAGRQDRLNEIISRGIEIIEATEE